MLLFLHKTLLCEVVAVLKREFLVIFPDSQFSLKMSVYELEI